VRAQAAGHPLRPVKENGKEEKTEERDRAASFLIAPSSRVLCVAFLLLCRLLSFVLVRLTLFSSCVFRYQFAFVRAINLNFFIVVSYFSSFSCRFICGRVQCRRSPLPPPVLLLLYLAAAAAAVVAAVALLPCLW